MLSRAGLWRASCKSRSSYLQSGLLLVWTLAFSGSPPSMGAALISAFCWSGSNGAEVRHPVILIAYCHGRARSASWKVTPESSSNWRRNSWPSSWIALTLAPGREDVSNPGRFHVHRDKEFDSGERVVAINYSRKDDGKITSDEAKKIAEIAKNGNNVKYMLKDEGKNVFVWSKAWEEAKVDNEMSRL
jgi:hypothetical protein